MGGGWYDREVQEVGNASLYQSNVFSANADQVFNAKQLHPDLNTFQRPIHCTNKSPVVCCVDVTGSMGKWPKVIWDKLPMFYGQILLKGYLEEPAFSFCAIGDAYGDKSPLQVTPFAQGNDIDNQISKIHIEGGGVGLKGDHETYELAAYYYSHLCYFDVEPKDKPFLFITGDESFYENINGEQVGKLITGEQPHDSPSIDIWKELCTKFQVILLHKMLDYGGPDDENVVLQWQQAIGNNHVIRINNPKACVDVMLGVIAIMSGKRNLSTYVDDMTERGQTAERVAEVKTALSVLV